MGAKNTCRPDPQLLRTFGLMVEDNPGQNTVWATEGSDLSALDYARYLLRATPTVRRTTRDIEPEEPSDHKPRNADIDPIEPATSDRSVVDRINEIISNCVARLASDIHFEPTEDGIRCRARIDGALLNHSLIPLDERSETLSRLKIMAGLDIAEKRRPQDGRIAFVYGGRAIDIRVSVIPCDTGEKAVLRLLDKESLRLDLGAIGFTQPQLTLFREKISLPNGIILVTGPTGSGKTTTLYAALNHLRSPSVNISTVEDPIEYNLEGINQTQIRPEIGVTFASMLRSLLRQDPNIIMVGEIRDAETLEIAVRASLTGHLVLSTIHTNSAPATAARLLDMGAEPSLLASSLRLIIAQRLVRLTCENCASSGANVENVSAAARLGIDSALIRSGSGCEHCSQTGFRGRTAVYELMPVTERVKHSIAEGQSEQELLAHATQEGYSPMRDTATELIRVGKTTPLEVLRELSD